MTDDKMLARAWEFIDGNDLDILARCEPGASAHIALAALLTAVRDEALEEAEAEANEWDTRDIARRIRALKSGGQR